MRSPQSGVSTWQIGCCDGSARTGTQLQQLHHGAAGAPCGASISCTWPKKLRMQPRSSLPRGSTSRHVSHVTCRAVAPRRTAPTAATRQSRERRADNTHLCAVISRIIFARHAWQPTLTSGLCRHVWHRRAVAGALCLGVGGCRVECPTICAPICSASRPAAVHMGAPAQRQQRQQRSHALLQRRSATGRHARPLRRGGAATREPDFSCRRR